MLLPIEHAPFANVYHRDTAPFSETCLPIGSIVSVREIGENKFGSPYVIANDLVDKAGLRDIPSRIHHYVE